MCQSICANREATDLINWKICWEHISTAAEMLLEALIETSQNVGAIRCASVECRWSNMNENGIRSQQNPYYGLRMSLEDELKDSCWCHLVYPREAHVHRTWTSAQRQNLLPWWTTECRPMQRRTAVLLWKSLSEDTSEEEKHFADACPMMKLAYVTK